MKHFFFVARLFPFPALPILWEEKNSCSFIVENNAIIVAPLIFTYLLGW